VRRADTIGAFTAHHEETKSPKFTKVLDQKDFRVLRIFEPS